MVGSGPWLQLINIGAKRLSKWQLCQTPCVTEKEDGMAHKVALYSRGGISPVGHVEFFTLLIQKGSDYLCDPPGILTPEQVGEISQTMRQLPQIQRGTVGEYEWKEQEQNG